MLRKLRWTLTAALAGGSLFGACEVRLRDAIVGGSKDYLSSLLSPDSVLQLLFPESDNASDTTNDQ
jgi:hypothetical protein